MAYCYRRTDPISCDPSSLVGVGASDYVGAVAVADEVAV